MAQDFVAKVTAELDTAAAEGKLNEFLNKERKIKIDVEVNQDSAKKLTSNIEKGIKSTKIDTSSISKARLEAQLKEQQDELDDTVRDHVYELQVDGLDELQDQLSEDFDEWAYNLSASVEKMSEAISEAVKNVGGNTEDALNSIAKILGQFGITPDQIGITASDLDTSNMKHYAKGTDKVTRKEVAMTNEEGRELILTKEGLITTLYPGDIMAQLSRQKSKIFIMNWYGG